MISPTRELAVQIKDESRKFSAGSGIKSAVLYGGTSTAQQRDQIRKGVNVLIATPGRLLQFVDEGIVKFNRLRLVLLNVGLGFMHRYIRFHYQHSAVLETSNFLG